ncbi:MAG: apolipoprotein N-acyltransferase [Prochloron sp. SP5CPC1]|nr:apolipoprotein N-acyltransferase [Candidatus Paraprochloron terpiosi SP5CPC1]
MGLTTAPVSAWFLAWVALVPLWILITRKDESYLLISLAWGLGYHGLALFWITGIHPMTWMGVPWLVSLAIALFCWLFITLWGAALVVAWCAVMRFLSLSSGLGRILVGVAVWCGLEAVWSSGPLWWSGLSYTQSPHNLAILQWSQVSGPSTITAAIVAVNGLIAEAVGYGTFRFWKTKSFIIALGFLVSCHGIGFWLFNRPVDTFAENAIKVGIIQGNIPNEIKLYPAGWRKAIEGYTAGYETLAADGVDIILTPETAFPFSWQYLVASSATFYRAILEWGVPVWVGALGEEGGNYTNRQAIVGICYESAFAEHFRRQTAAGGEFIITAANNAHYSNSMPAQHHAQDVMRAIESDRWAARATNTGYSAIIDPRGRTLWISQINTYQLHKDTIYKRQTQTLYVRWGDWLTKVLLVLGTIEGIKAKVK